MSKESFIKKWISPLTIAHFLLMLNIGLNIFIKSDAIYILSEKIGIFFIIPAIGLWILPVLTLRRHGHVSEYGSFLATTELVDKGLYAIIRHPQYLGYMLLSIGMCFYFQLDFTIILSIATILFLFLGIREEDKLLIEQFGDEYIIYKKRVPSVNLISGLIKYLIRILKK